MRQFQFGSARTMSPPAKFAAIAFGIVLLLPILALLLIAGAFAASVFILLLIFGKIRKVFTPSTQKDDSEGRKNVRVKR